MDCRKVKEIVFVYADNEMDGELLVSFRQHVSICPECARETVLAERLVTVVRKRCARALAPEQLRQRILTGLRSYLAEDSGIAAVIRHFGWPALLAFLALAALPQQARAAVEIAGLTHLDGTAVVADDITENALFVVFSTWSPKCRNIVEQASDIHSDWGGRAKVFLVNFQEGRAAVDKFLAGRSLEVEVLLDPDASFSKKHKITYLPSLLAVKDGNAAFRGKLPADAKPVLRPIYE